jgi:short-subunit dehydrogenase
VLVNNAGFGSAGLFQRLDGEREAELVRLNCEVVVDLCGRFVPAMVEHGDGAVLNIASTAGFQPLPTQATYSASKAFVLTFTQALGADLHGTGVTATVLCPGPVRTEFGEVAGLRLESVMPEFAWVDSADVAEAGVRGLERGKGVVIPGAINRATAVGGQFTPRSLLLSLGRRVYRVGDA